MARILHCVSSLQPGGVEKRVVNQLQWLQRESHDDHVLVAFRGGALLDAHADALASAGVTTVALDKRRALDPAFARHFRGAVSELAPELVIAYNLVAAFWARVLLGSHHGGTVVHEGGIRSAGTRWGPPLERALAPWTRARIYNSHATERIWTHVLGRAGDGHVVLNGVALPDTGQRPEPGPPFTLLAVGRLVPVKGIEILLHAVAALRRQVPDVALLVVGDGPHRAALCRLATVLGLDRSVTWCGYQPDPAPFYRRAHAYVCTSYNETFSLSLCEAMSHGLACVVPRIGGPAEIVRDGREGLVLPCRIAPPRGVARRLPRLVCDPTTGRVGPPLGIAVDDLVHALARLAAEPQLRTRLGRDARTRALGDFSLARYGRDLMSVYRGLLATRTRA